MIKVKCVNKLYLDITKGKIYDVIEYKYYNELIIGTIKILNDKNVTNTYQIKALNALSIRLDVFQDVTHEYRASIIEEILM